MGDIIDEWLGSDGDVLASASSDKSGKWKSSNRHVSLVTADGKGGLGVEPLRNSETSHLGKGKGKGEGERRGDGKKLSKSQYIEGEEDMGVALIEESRTTLLKRKDTSGNSYSDTGGRKRKQKKKNTEIESAITTNNINDYTNPKSISHSKANTIDLVQEKGKKHQIQEHGREVEEEQEKIGQGEYSRKRKKKRSKQKNILKDKRAVKPAHLMDPTSAAYRGHELSNVTKTKLGMPLTSCSGTDIDIDTVDQRLATD